MSAATITAETVEKVLTTAAAMGVESPDPQEVADELNAADASEQLTAELDAQFAALVEGFPAPKRTANPADLEEITVECELPECIEDGHCYVAYDPGSIDPHRALRIDRKGGDREVPAEYWVEVFKMHGGTWLIDLYATECIMNPGDVPQLLIDIQAATDLAAKLNAQDAQQVGR